MSKEKTIRRIFSKLKGTLQRKGETKQAEVLCLGCEEVFIDVVYYDIPDKDDLDGPYCRSCDPHWEVLGRW